MVPTRLEAANALGIGPVTLSNVNVEAGIAGVSGGATPAGRTLASGDAGCITPSEGQELSMRELFVRAWRVVPTKRQRTKSDHQKSEGWCVISSQ